MLIFELNCKSGHAFEGWFDSLEEMETQIADNLVECPLCGSNDVYKVPSAFAIGNKARERAPLADAEPGLEQTTQVIQQAIHKYLKENFEDVGTSFFKEALKMHYGASPMRNIRGVSSIQEEDVLRQEGVDFFKLQDDLPVTPKASLPTPKPPKSSH